MPWMIIYAARERADAERPQRRGNTDSRCSCCGRGDVTAALRRQAAGAAVGEMRARPLDVPGDLALLPIDTVTGGVPWTPRGLGRLAWSLATGDALALRVCLCMPTFRFKETEESFMAFLLGEAMQRRRSGAAGGVASLRSPAPTSLRSARRPGGAG